jgi:hypothetical protein
MTSFITCGCIKHTSLWTGIEITTLVNKHMNMANIVSLYQILDIMLSQMRSKKLADIGTHTRNVLWLC